MQLSVTHVIVVKGRLTFGVTPLLDEGHGAFARPHSLTAMPRSKVRSPDAYDFD